VLLRGALMVKDLPLILLVGDHPEQLQHVFADLPHDVRACLSINGK